MPTVYVYDETRVDYFITEDFGSISGPEAVIESIDLGNVSQLADPVEFDALQFNINDYGFVTRVADVLPFGSVSISGTTKTTKAFVPAISGPILVTGTGKESRTRSTWIGSGTLFEIGGGLERLVIPDFGAAGPSPTITGQAVESNIVNYKGDKVQFTLSSSAQTREFNVYPVFSTATFTVTGGTSQEYPNEYIQSIVQEQLVGKSQNSISYKYALTEIIPFDEEDWGLLSDLNGSSFDNSAVSFDSTSTTESAFSDALVVEYVNLGTIIDTPTEFEDYGIVSTSYKFGGINTTKKSAYGIKGTYSKSFDYIGSGSLHVDPSPTTQDLSTDRSRSFKGSGSINLNGQLGLGQAPQHRVFGLEGKFTISGACTQRFIPRPVRGSGISIFSSESRYRKVLNPRENTQLFQIYGYVDNVKTIFYPSRNTLNLKLSGQATRLQLFKSYKGSDRLKFSGELTTKDVRFAPHWRSPLERDGYIEPVDYGFINELPTEPNEDWGWVRDIPLSIAGGAGMDFGYIIPLFRAITLVGIGAESFVRDTYRASGTLTVSDPAYVTPTFAFKSSGKSGIATHNTGFFFSGELWLSQAPQHTVFGIGDYIVLSGSKTESFVKSNYDGSGTISISGAYENLQFTSGAGEQTVLTTISGSSDTKFAPHISGSGSITLTQGREEGQTYLRIITTGTNIPPSLFSIYNLDGSIQEKNTESYNESAILEGDPSPEDYGLLAEFPSYGFDLTYLGAGSGGLTETFDDESATYDQDIINGSKFSDDLLGGGLLPTFDKNDQYPIDYSSVNASEDYGLVGNNIVGGAPSYDRFLYPNYTGFSDQENIDKGYEDLGFIADSYTKSAQYPFGKITLAQPAFANISRVIPKYPGLGTLVVSSSAIEKFVTGDSSTQLFAIGGSGTEAYSAQTPENTQLFEYSGTRDSESTSVVEIGTGSIAISDTLVEKVTFTEVRSGIITISDSAIESFVANPPENTELFQIYGAYQDLKFVSANVAEKATLRLLGELNHPEIDYTPHYGIERNIGIETGFILVPGGAGGEYGDPGITTTRFLPKYPGGYAGGGTAGPIKLSDKAIARTNAPIITDGTIYILGIGTAANGDLDGVEIGATWRVIPASITAGRPGLISIKGNALTREIQIYASYGDLRTPGTSGVITISTEKRKTEEKSVFRYNVSGGQISISGSRENERKTKAYRGRGTLFTVSSGTPSRTKSFTGSGSINITGSARYKVSSIGVADTVLFTISGSAKKSVRLTTDFGGTLRLSGTVGNIGDPIRTKSFKGSGKYSTLSGASWSRTRPSAATTVLVQVGGSAKTREIQVYGYYGDLKDPGTSGTITIYGQLTHPQIDFTPAYKASGLFTISGVTKPIAIRRILDIGGTVNISGSATTKFVSQAGESTVLFRILGSANTRELNVYQGYQTTGLFTISGISTNREIQVYGYYGDQKNPGTSGVITISGRTLVHPEVRYIPSPDGSGTIFVRGSAQPRRIYPNYPGFGTLFTLSSVKESYTRTTYIGIGNVTLSSNALTELTEFEEPRTYVVII